MASGSEGTNVLPQEAWVIGNMRFSPHQGGKSSIEEITRLAEKFDIETEILDPGMDSGVTDYRSEQFKLIEKAVGNIFDGVRTSPWIMTGASDCRYMCRISDHCVRFVPFLMKDEQIEGIHGINEYVEIKSLAPAVDFYRYVIKEV
jgi:acetylornithine deacetylase/succinyl-diaminopimelate desuccinylase-like protein